ncbi:MAG: MSEP-CTERM sorting domain-containing protein, partial [Flavobacteriales bacterium]
LNGLVVVWGESQDPRTRMVQFILRSIGFSYVLYFFVLFVPFLPLSILAILAFGLGFLLLAPVLLFIVQGMQLVHDIRFLREQRSLPALLGTMLLSALLIPGIITGVYLQQRSALHTALAQVFDADPEAKPERVNADALQSVLTNVRGNKERRGWARDHMPFITPWFNKVVMDNLMLSDAKLKTLDRIYLGEDPDTLQAPIWRPRAQLATVTLDSASARPYFDESQRVWRTWVDLQMTNPERFQNEYRATFNLPAGAWISDQYLMIEGEEVKGVLAERKAATWIYQQIRDVRRDPSLTRYVAPGVIELRVFPLEVGQTRHAGFEVLHKEPFALTIESCTVQLGDYSHGTTATATTSEDGRVAYIPAAVKRKLSVVQRPPQIHIIVDASEAGREERSHVLAAIDLFIRDHQVDPATVTLHITDSYSSSLPWSEDSKKEYLEHTGEGGFFSDRPIRRVLTEAGRHPGKERPVIVIAPTNYNDGEKSLGVWLDDLGELAFCLPEAPEFFMIQGGTLSARNFNAPFNDLEGKPLPTASRPSYAWPNAREPQAYLPVNDAPTIALLKSGSINTDSLKIRDWMDALHLEGRWR